jgi:gamma-glutamyltranspeptidase / glutathione hydrolase
VTRLGRPALLGAHHAISTTHYLATEAGASILRRGGTAIDAGIAAGIALGVVERHVSDLGGVAPIIVHRPGMAQPETIDGLGRWPARMDLDGFLARYGGSMPEGLPRAVTPAAVDAWLTALERHGTLRLEEVCEPALELTRGFPVFPRLAEAIAENASTLAGWPASAEVFLPGGRVPQVGETFVQPDLERLLTGLCRTERAHAHQGRSSAIRAARDGFYRGDTAERIASFLTAEGSVMDLTDLASAQAEVGPGVVATYRGVEVHACGPWSQGPLVPMTLALLEGFDDLAGREPEDPLWLHRFAESMKLALADREGFFGDPGLVEVPMSGLLHRDYLAARRDLIDDDHANPGLPVPGDPWPFEGRDGPAGYVPPTRTGPSGPDTTYVCAMDAEGNAFSATPSDSGLSSPLVPGLGIIVSSRGSQLWLEPDHPSAIAPRKRPRLTPNPAMLLRDGVALMPFGCPGGDAQAQAMVQVASHVMDRGMSTQDAIERPRVISYTAPDSFYPHGAQPGVLGAEAHLPAAVRRDLERRGHRIEVMDRWTPAAAAVCAIRRLDSGALEAGADPRRESLASAW